MQKMKLPQFKLRKQFIKFNQHLDNLKSEKCAKSDFNTGIYRMNSNGHIWVYTGCPSLASLPQRIVYPKLLL